MTSRRSDRAVATEFTAVAAAWLATHRSWNTRAAYEADLAWFAEWCAQTGRSPLLATQDDIEQHRADCATAGAGPATIRRRLAALSSFFAYSATAEESGGNPAANVQRPDAAASTSTAGLDEHEAERLNEAAQALGPKTVLLVSLLMDAGLKLGEAIDANADDFATPPPALTIMRGGRPQAVPVPASTAAAIVSSISGRRSGPLLLGNATTRSPGRLTRAGANHIVKRAAQHAGITKPVSANTLRRFYATNAHANGMHIDEIRARLGHDDRRTTQRLLDVQDLQSSTE
jgi:site-specific recombinase XerD